MSTPMVEPLHHIVAISTNFPPKNLTVYAYETDHTDKLSTAFQFPNVGRYVFFGFFCGYGWFTV
jgi:hypothetical protein